MLRLLTLWVMIMWMCKNESFIEIISSRGALTCVLMPPCEDLLRNISSVSEHTEQSIVLDRPSGRLWLVIFICNIFCNADMTSTPLSYPPKLQQQTLFRAKYCNIHSEELYINIHKLILIHLSKSNKWNVLWFFFNLAFIAV